MELRRLRCFATVAELLHFGRAAERLKIAQPALSLQIQLLEKELGVVLLERDRRRVELTPVGAILLGEVREILAREERARLIVQCARRGELGRIEIGYVGSVAYSGVLARSVTSLGRQAPDIELSIHELELEEQLDQLREGRIDVAFLRLPAGDKAKELAVVPICEEEVMIALPIGHRLSECGGIRPAALASETFLATNLREGLGFFDTQLQICRDAGFEPRIAARARHFATMMNLVAVGRGVALVPSPVSRLALPGVVYRALQTRRTSPVAVLHRPGDRAPALARYLALCVAAGQAVAARPPDDAQ
ncbi:MAG: LysR family transcriptional regulator [Bosea sp.]|uniref:LysR substrate-binding domain-containing protein n=1 Tax=Bosea sp. (in: a-proteobacteria) TaxID=1871050 RepID=UPI0010F8B60A|nr:LysR family transcriptional regulator [Bosea sp. (in: a-proteobacteria)]MCP4734836.1 LysR family transcriptional regulator [Bosea sp. (in: a-proteobacteria)]